MVYYITALFLKLFTVSICFSRNSFKWPRKRLIILSTQSMYVYINIGVIFSLSICLIFQKCQFPINFHSGASTRDCQVDFSPVPPHVRTDWRQFPWLTGRNFSNFRLRLESLFDYSSSGLSQHMKTICRYIPSYFHWGIGKMKQYPLSYLLLLALITCKIYI